VPRYDYECPLGTVTEREFAVAKKPRTVKCGCCGRRARAIVSEVATYHPDRNTDDRYMSATKVEGDLAQRASILKSFAEGNVADFRPGKGSHLSTPTESEIDHAVKMGPGKKGVLPERKPAPRKDAFRVRAPNVVT
jgi:hypothetical protein